MIANANTVPYQQHPLIPAQVLSRSVYVAPPSKTDNKQPRLRTLLSQAGCAGMFAYFLFLVVSNAVYLNPYVLVFLPVLLAMAFGLGIIEGLLIWACNRMAGHRLNALSRTAIAVFVSSILSAAVSLLFSTESTELTEYFWIIGCIIFICLTIGWLTGSRVRPWRALVRGDGTKSVVLAGITGFLLRSAVVFGFMESVLFLIFTLRINVEAASRLWAPVAAVHFTVAMLVVFAKLRFSRLFPMALLVNVPVALFVLKFHYDLGLALYVIAGYLVAWAMFLLTRWRRTYEALAIVGEELRYYYLID